MTAENFCYWLRGIFEIQMAGLDSNEKRVPKLTEPQIEMIAKHLNMVMNPVVTIPDKTTIDMDAVKIGSTLC